MHTESIYEETIPFSFIKIILFMMAALAVVFFILFIYQAFVGSLGKNPAPFWFYLLMFLWFSVLTIFVLNFRRLEIRITTQSIKLGYGIFKPSIPWSNVQSCYLDKSSNISYGGWGMRIARVNNKWRRVFNVIGYPRVVIELKQGRFKELVFSSSKPEEVMLIINQQIAQSS